VLSFIILIILIFYLNFNWHSSTLDLEYRLELWTPTSASHAISAVAELQRRIYFQCVIPFSVTFVTEMPAYMH